jgi:tRNA(Ile)-lysidine synthetase-like protein
MAMLDALCALSRERPALRVVAAHFDHRLRADSARDRDLVAEFAAVRGVPVRLGEGDVRARARLSRRSIEEAARDERYAFLERAANETGADFIATAHTRCDQIETVLMRILRGAGARGLAGIPERRERVVRPLLGVSRPETLAYCRERGIPFATDMTNTDPRFLRNRIRHEMLPELRRVYPGIDAALERMAANARLEFERVERITEKRVAACLRLVDAGGFALGLEAFVGLDDEDERIHLLAGALKVMHAQRDVSRTHYRALLDLAHNGGRGARCVDLPRIRARREHDAIVFAPRAPHGHRHAAPPRALSVPGRVTIGEWEISADIVSGEVARAEIGRAVRARRASPQSTAGRRDLRGRGGVTFVAPPADAPLVVRFPRPGDRMRPFGMNGHKKLSDLFIDAKVPRRERAHTPVLEAAGEIVWVAGVAASETARIDDAAACAICLRATRVDAGTANAGLRVAFATGRDA